MPRVLYLDCFNGVAGDMLIGALIDAGLPLAELQAALGSLALDGCTISAERVSRAGVGATKFRVNARSDVASGFSRTGSDRHGHHAQEGPAKAGRHGIDHPHTHDHGHPHTQDPGHRTLAEIGALIDRSALSEGGRRRARELFTRLGEAEAAIHQTTLDRVHLHEVGALDSIVDIVGAVFGLDWFGADRIVASPLNVGSGTVVCEHGTFPVPAPATARLLEGAPVYSSGVQAELVTPTGALLVTGYASSYGPLPAMRIDRVGYGAGDRDLPGTPNVVRVIVGDEIAAEATRPLEPIVVLECEIDDMNPQIFGGLMDRLHAAGALDVYYAAIQMKKNRPGTLVTVLAPPDRREELSGLLFRETTTIGVRFQEMQRERLDREIVTVPTPLGAVRFKVARRGGAVVNAAPEFDDCARLAAEHGLPVKEVQAVATQAYREQVRVQ